MNSNKFIGTPGAFKLAGLLTSIFIASNAMAGIDDLLEMSEKLDNIEKQDFVAAIDRANACTKARNFSCTEAQLAKASKSAGSAKDRQTVLAARQNMEKEKAQIAEEYRLAEAARVKAEEQLRLAEEAEQRRIARAEQAEEEARQSETNKQGLFAIAGAIGIAKLTGGKNFTDAQRSDLVNSFAKDRANAANGVSSNNFGESADKVKGQLDTARADAERARQASERARQQAAQQAAEEKRRESERQKNEAERQRSQQYAQAAAPVRQPVCPAGYSLVQNACVKDASGPAKSTMVAGNSSPLASRGDAGTTQSRTVAGGANKTTIAANVGETPDSATVSKPQNKKIKWGPVQLEAIAICHQSAKSKKWRCIGSLDDEIIYDSATLEESLGRQHCDGGTWAAGGPVFEGVQWDAYRCNRSLGAGDYDVAKRFNLITARRSYMCPEYEPSDGRCTTFYDGQDLPSRN